MHHAVAALLEEAEEGAADLVGTTSPPLAHRRRRSRPPVLSARAALRPPGSRPSRASLHRGQRALQAGAHEVGGVAPPQQERPQLPHAPRGLVAPRAASSSAGRGRPGPRASDTSTRASGGPLSATAAADSPLAQLRRGCDGGPGRGSEAAPGERLGEAARRPGPAAASRSTAASTSASAWPAGAGPRRSSPSAWSRRASVATARP